MTADIMRQYPFYHAGQTIDWLLSTLKVIPAGQKEFLALMAEKGV